MVGIAGIGMSGLAEILLHKGFKVTGSDRSGGEAVRRLISLGATVFEGHDAAWIEGADVVVYTSAVQAHENVETAEALARGIPVIKRAEMLAELMRMKYGIGIAGTHGKTTTTTMAGHVVQEGGFDPTIIVGGRVHSFDKTNAVVGKGDMVIVEADEFDRTFLQLNPSLVAITNVDIEHMDIYTDEEDIKKAFTEFANKVPFYGAVVLCLEDPRLRSLVPGISRRLLTYGFTPQAMLRAERISTDRMYSRFDVIFDGKRLGEARVQAPGEHNILNALAAIGIGIELGIPFEKIAAGLGRYSGVFRRFQVKYDAGDILVIDDYAHHPTEVRATLAAARKGWPEKRIVAIFQPHLYSRTAEMYEEFGLSFFDAEMLVVTDVYASREKPVAGIDGNLVAHTARSCGHRNVTYVAAKEELPAHLSRLVQPGDMVITMGAGDIYRYAEAYVHGLQSGKDARSAGTASQPEITKKP